MSESELWISFQLCDSAFPGGCLANSQGLESALNHGLVERDNAESVFRFLAMSVEQAIWLQLPFCRTAHALVGSDFQKQSSSLHELDAYFHAIVSNDVARRASINQGKCFLRAVRDTFPAITKELDNVLISEESRSSYRFHFAPLFGFICGLLKISLQLCDRMLLRMLVRDVVSSATRLSIIGPMKGSYLQASMTPVMEELLQENQKAMEESASNGVQEGIRFYKGLLPVLTTPILEFVQSRHDLMYTRLFNT